MTWEFVKRFGNCSFESNLKSGHNLHITHQCLPSSKHFGMPNNTCFDKQIDSFDSLSICTARIYNILKIFSICHSDVINGSCMPYHFKLWSFTTYISFKVLKEDIYWLIIFLIILFHSFWFFLSSWVYEKCYG